MRFKATSESGETLGWYDTAAEAQAALDAQPTEAQDYADWLRELRGE